MKTILLLIAITLTHSALLDQNATTCTDVLNSKNFSGSCQNQWQDLKSLLRPTQAQVGFVGVARKLEDFDSPSNAQKEMSEKIVPVIIGPNHNDESISFYVTDGHHTLSALDYSGYNETIVTLTVLCDLRNLPTWKFWIEMYQQHKVYLLARSTENPHSLPQFILPSDLPSSFSFTKSNTVFTNDVYRSLGTLVRKVKANNTCDYKYAMRCYDRLCENGATGSGVKFVEFQWGYYFSNTYIDSSLWPSQEQYQQWKKNFDSMPDTTFDNIDVIDVDTWMSVAEDMIPLCRETASSYSQLPRWIFPNNTLWGVVPNWQCLGKDPKCSGGSCQ